MEYFKLRPKVIYFITIVFIIFFSQFYTIAESAEKTVELNAEKVTYDDEFGTASAEGGAVLTYGDVRITAERIDYNDETGKIVASSLPEKGIVLSNGKQALRGEKLEYDLNTAEGIISGAKSTLAVGGTFLYVYGDNLEAIPYELAVERNLISNKSSYSGEYVIKWDNVSVTTCMLDHPHYRLEAKRFIFTPGHRVVVKSPRLYLSEKFIFTYPFDYIINVKRDSGIKTAIFPTVSYQSTKGTEIGFSGPITWDSGGIDFGVSYWTEIGFEWNVALEQRIGESFSIWGELQYSWDRVWDEKKLRPHVSLRYDQPYWFARLNWRESQYIEIQKNADYQYRGELDTAPEFVIGTNWLQSGQGWYRASAMWGQYRASTILANGTEVTEPWRNRFRIAAESYIESNTGAISPFLNLNASMAFYEEDMRQDVISLVFGLRYDLGKIKLGTAYSQSWVSGETIMSWDQEFDSEKIYQMLEFPLGKYFSLSILGGYDLEASFLSEMNYTLRYLNDCMLWELTYRNDRNFGGENKVFFRIGFTGTSVEIKNEEIFNPFDSPVTQDTVNK